MLRVNLEITRKRNDGGLDLEQIGELQIVNHVHEDGYYHIRGWIKGKSRFANLKVEHEYNDGAFILTQKALAAVNALEGIK